MRAEHFASHEAHGRSASLVALAIGTREERGRVNELTVVGRELNEPGRDNGKGPRWPGFSCCRFDHGHVTGGGRRLDERHVPQGQQRSGPALRDELAERLDAQIAQPEDGLGVVVVSIIQFRVRDVGDEVKQDGRRPEERQTLLRHPFLSREGDIRAAQQLQVTLPTFTGGERAAATRRLIHIHIVGCGRHCSRDLRHMTK